MMGMMGASIQKIMDNLGIQDPVLNADLGRPAQTLKRSNGELRVDSTSLVNRLSVTNADGTLENASLFEFLENRKKSDERKKDLKDKASAAKPAVQSWLKKPELYAAAGVVAVYSDKMDLGIHPYLSNDASEVRDPNKMANPAQLQGEGLSANVEVEFESWRHRIQTFEAQVPESWNKDYNTVVDNLEASLKNEELNKRLGNFGYSEDARLGLLGALPDYGDDITPAEQLEQTRTANRLLSEELDNVIGDIKFQRDEIGSALEKGEIQDIASIRDAKTFKTGLEMQLHKDTALSSQYELKQLGMQLEKPEPSLYTSTDLTKRDGLDRHTAVSIVNDLEKRLEEINDKAIDLGIDEKFWESVKTFGDPSKNDAERKAFQGLGMKVDKPGYERSNRATELEMGNVYDISKELAMKEMLIQAHHQINNPDIAVSPGRGINALMKLGAKSGADMQIYLPSEEEVMAVSKGANKAGQDIDFKASTISIQEKTGALQYSKLHGRGVDLSSQQNHIVDHQKFVKDQLVEFIKKTTDHAEALEAIGEKSAFDATIHKAANFVTAGERSNDVELAERNRIKTHLNESLGSDKADKVMDTLDKARATFKKEMGVDKHQSHEQEHTEGKAQSKGRGMSLSKH